MSRKIDIPELCLVLLVGTSSSGKSTFAVKHFAATEIISSDACRAAVSDDANDQNVTKEAFELVHKIVGLRLRLGRLTVVDATNVQPESRKALIALAKEHNVFCVALVFDLPDRVLFERHALRTDRPFDKHVIRNQKRDLHRSMRGIEREGCRFVHVFKDPEDADNVTIARTRLWTNLNHEHGPFDVVGDVHGCLDELLILCRELGYAIEPRDEIWTIGHSQGRRLVFVGDLVDRGPDSYGVVRFVRAVLEQSMGFCVAGNHDVKLSRALRGRDVKVSHGLERSLEQMRDVDESARQSVAAFLDGLVSHYVMDDGKLVVAHAGLSEELQGRSSAKVRSFAMYGETTGETDEFGLPVRYEWAKDYRGQAMVVYGHTPVAEAEWLNNTICLDTGCVFGGKLTALRYPERELVSVPAGREYYPPVRPLAAVSSVMSAQAASDDLLDFADVSGKRYIRTRLNGTVQVREENAAAALEVMSRFAANPKWLIYLPPTMSPSGTSGRPGLLEHPDEAFAYFRQAGVRQVVCEEKHMGSRAVVVVCRTVEAARRRFGTTDGRQGIVYTRTGREFFNDRAVQDELVGLIAGAVDRSALWDELTTDWMCIDAEIMPWSAKAIDLIRSQYAPVGAAGMGFLSALGDLLTQASGEDPDIAALRSRTAERLAAVHDYRAAYAHYCWDVNGLADVRIAPFHILATESAVHVDRDHRWHMAMGARLAEALPSLIVATPHRIVDLAEKTSCSDAASWWEGLTAKGGEGMVVKPTDFVTRGVKGLVQPALKCRGPEYLRIIYGPEYALTGNLERLRERSVTGKRANALREFALGVEALERFVAKQPLRAVHECVFGVLALESEPLDPRL